MSEPTGTYAPPPAVQPTPPAWPHPSQPPSQTALTGSLLAAAVILFVMAVLAALASAAALLGGSLYDQIPNQTGLSDEQFRAALQMGQVFAIAFGVIGMVAAIAHALAGVGILRRAGWARILGIVLAVLAVLLTLISLIGVLAAAAGPIPPGSLSTSGFTQEQAEEFYRMGAIFGGVIAGMVLLAYLFVLIVLVRSGRGFHRA